MSFKLKLKAAPPFFVHLYEAFLKLCQCLEKIFPQHSDEPMVMIAIDEAQRLATMQGLGANEYRPVDTLYEVVNEFSHGRGRAVWVVFASTASEIADFTPPKICECGTFVVVNL